MNLNKILRGGIIIGILATAFLPLVVAPSLYFPFITGKNFLFRIIVSLIFAAWLWLAYRDPSVRPRRSSLLLGYGAFFGIQLLATIFSVDPSHSLWSNFERMDGFLAALYLFAYFMVVASVVRDRRTWRMIWWTTLGAGLISIIHGFTQLSGLAEIHQGGVRLDANLGNAAYLAVYMLFQLFLAGYLYATTHPTQKIARGALLVFILLAAIILFHTATRGAMLGALLGLGIFLLLLFLRSAGQLRRRALSALLILLCAGGGFFLIKDTSFVRGNQVLNRFASISLSDTTTQSRFTIWRMSWKGFQEHPVLGWGPENYPLVFQKYYTPEMWKQEPWFDRSHNIVFDLLINYGALGLLVYLAIFLSAFRLLWRPASPGGESETVGRYLLLGLFAGYFFQNLFVFDNLTSSWFFVTMLAAIHALYGPARPDQELPASSSVRDRPWEPAVVLVVLIVILGSGYYLTWRSLTTGRVLIQALTPVGSLADRLASFRYILDRTSVIGKLEAREQLLSAATVVARDPNVPVADKEGFARAADEEAEKYLRVATSDARFLTFYSPYLLATGRSEEALAASLQAAALSPDKQPILFDLASAYFALGRSQEGLVVLKRAYESAPEYAEARNIYALGALWAGEKALADQILGEDKAKLINDERFLNFYATHRYFDEVVMIWQTRAAAAPDDKQVQVSLAGAYYFAGRRAEAIAVIEDYARRHPDFAAEAAAMTKQIRSGEARVNQ